MLLPGLPQLRKTTWMLVSYSFCMFIHLSGGPMTSNGEKESSFLRPSASLHCCRLSTKAFLCGFGWVSPSEHLPLALHLSFWRKYAFLESPDINVSCVIRGGRYIDEKLSKADKAAFLKLSATYRNRKMEILKLSNNYRYRKMHQILADK